MKSKYLFPLCVLLLTGCFETQFEFKTVVNDDGSVSRETRVEGRGAHFFKSPEGNGWESRSSGVKKETTFFVNGNHHILAYGHFEPGQFIPADYVFDFEQHAKNWGEDQVEKLKSLGINPPFEESLFSRNEIKVTKSHSWLTEVYTYEETFRNSGLIDLLLIDIKEDLRREAELTGQPVDDALIHKKASQRLGDDILQRIRFRSEVTLPGDSLEANTSTRQGKAFVWEFSLKDFDNNYSEYTLKASSKALRLPGVIYVLCVGFISVLALIFLALGVRQFSKKAKA